MPQLRDIPRRPAFSSNQPKMAVPPKQQPMPPEAHPTQLRPVSLAALSGNQEAFIESISGPVITVQVGPQSFTLPMKLLAKNSSFFRNEIMSLGSVLNKKRKRTPKHEDRAEAAVKAEEMETENEKALEAKHAKPTEDTSDVPMENTEAATKTAHQDAAETLASIKEEEKLQEPEPEHEQPRPSTDSKKLYVDCSDIDPFVFGLFLKFIYTGFYAVQIDAQHFATMAAMPTPTHPPYVPPTSTSYAHPAPAPVPFEQASHEEKARQLLHLIISQKGGGGPNTSAAPDPAAPLPPTTTTAPKPRPIESFVPPSIHAYLLAHRLGSPAFMNHTIHHIYHAIGRDFPLTPWLVDWVWRKTCSFISPSTTHAHGKKKKSDNPTATAPSTTPPPPTSTNSASTPTAAGANGPSNASSTSLLPLRRLILDILIHHWPSQATHIIARNQGGAWNRVFDLHGELRHEVMMGLQGGVKVRAVEGYYVRVRI